MSSPKCRSFEVINNPARPGSNHREVNCINYKQHNTTTTTIIIIIIIIMIIIKMKKKKKLMRTLR
jgi:hypothetical protein